MRAMGKFLLNAFGFLLGGMIAFHGALYLAFGTISVGEACFLTAQDETDTISALVLLADYDQNNPEHIARCYVISGAGMFKRGVAWMEEATR
jgi:hypothetical protein